jgi:integrase/recombinase XerD
VARVAAPSRRAPFPGDLADAAGFRAFSRDFLEAQRVAGRTPRTVDTYERILRYFASWAIERGIAGPREVTRPILERYQRHLFHYRKASGEPLTFGSQQQRLAPLAVFFRWLVRQRFLPANPAADLEIPRVRRRLPKDVLTPEEAEQVLAIPDLATPEGLRDRAILELFYSTGIRRLELAQLKLWDVDRLHRTVFVREGKGRKDRVVPVGERALAWLDRYLSDSRPRWIASSDPGFLFLSPAGGAIRPDGLTAMARAHIERAGLKKRGACHIFRHTMATAMLENGADIRFIQQILGHESLETTQIYTRVSIRQLSEVHAATHPAARLERKTAAAKEENGERLKKECPAEAHPRPGAGDDRESLLEALSQEASEEDGAK